MRNLYILKGFTLASSTLFVSHYKSHYALWQMCLGHISKTWMEVLCKRGLLGNHQMEAL